MSDETTAKPRAGWYAHPTQDGMLRWWDGKAWTDQTKPARGGFGLRKTPEEKAAKEADKAERQFNASPQGQARLAFKRGDVVFQLAMPLREQQAVIAPMVGGTTTAREKDWTAVLNDVVREGWDLVNGSVAFIQTGSDSRDKFLASGQQVAVSGTVMGYYLFQRREQ